MANFSDTASMAWFVTQVTTEAAPGRGQRIRNMDRLNADGKQQNMLLVTKFRDFTTGYHRKGWE